MKPGTFTQMYVHLVFSPKHRDTLLLKDARPRIFEYMSGIISNLKHKSIIVNGMSDHVHILFGLNPDVSVSDTVHDIKRGSSLFINKENILRGKFAWQDGYGGFTYSKSQISDLYKYIQNQEVHHQQQSFRKEYMEYLRLNEIEFKDEYLFGFFE